MIEIKYPKKIIKACFVAEKENLLKKQRLQIDLNEPYVAKTQKGSYIILDYGQEMRGGIRILASESDGSAIRVRFGESVAECCSELGVCGIYTNNCTEVAVSEKAKRQNATNDHATRDMYITLPAWSSTPVGDTGYRFVRLDFDGEYTIKSVVAENIILKRRAKYLYRGDREIEKIFKAAKRTIDLCVGSGYIWDGVKRDRLVWVGDLAPEIMALTSLYGKCPEIEESIDLAREHTPIPRYMDGICTYSLWWMIIVADYAKIAGEDFTLRQLDYLEALTEHFLKGIDENGEMNYPMYFVNWPLYGSPEEKDGFRAIATVAMRSAAELLEKQGRNATYAREALRRFSAVEIKATCKVITALKYYAGCTLDDDDREVLMSNGAEGMSTFMAYYILKAMAAYDKEHAIKVMKEYFGGMLALGSTTFWEEFDSSWASLGRIDRMMKKDQLCAHGDTGSHCYVGFRMSLCHGWASGVIAFIKEYCD